MLESTANEDSSSRLLKNIYSKNDYYEAWKKNTAELILEQIFDIIVN